MAVLDGQQGLDLRWVPGALGLHEEFAQTIVEPIVRFVGVSSR
jgi:hypothetical protein